MPIDSKHPTYLIYEDDWTDCRQCFEGQRAVKAAGVRHLPKLKGQNDEEYSAYKKRALFYSITSKTISALIGMAMDKPPELKFPEKMKSYFEDRSGTQFFELFANSLTEIILTGRIGVLIDRPAGGGKPFVSLYNTEAIYNWATSEDGQLIMVVLRETYLEADSADPYVQNVKTRYRKLEIVNGKLVITIHTQSAKDGPFTESAPTTIQNTGVQMEFIPFFVARPSGIGIEPEKPPMLDIVDINLSHYRTSADLEHGRHFTGLPTPYVTGADSEVKLNIGSTSAWVIPNHNSKVGFLEFTGQGLQSLEKAMVEKQSQLASLSARLIDNSSRGSEAAETVKLRYMSETASLRTIVRSVEALLNLVYNTIAVMEGEADNSVIVSLHKDFLDGRMSAAELKAWTEAYLKGAVSKEMLIHALKRGDALPPPGVDPGKIPDPPKPEPSNPNTP